ncbi:MAG TPA: 5'-3' exonuclease H3TH domain-containing protein [Acidimicrobiales bacterium]|nr:5'-3' exonuclease H3TH domain-containing protein [Acidimicrobiales bacterium]
MGDVRVYLVDGTYELFRHFYGMPEENRQRSRLGAVRGVIETLLGLLGEGVTHLGVATDHVIESFRNDLWPSYKSSEGMDPQILAQFAPLEEAITALGVHLWAMTDLEADDAIASAAAVAADDPAVERVVIVSPDKDLAQCVRGTRVVQVDRRQGKVFDDAGVVAKFGVPPESVPDWLALVGDSADGYPGLPGWGAKSTAAVLATYGHLADIPDAPGKWEVTVRGAPKLAMTLSRGREAAELFLDLATLRVDRSLLPSVAVLQWQGPTDAFGLMAERLGAPHLLARARALAAARH